MEEEIQAIKEVKHTKPRTLIPMDLEIFAYKTSRYLASEESEEDLMSSDEEGGVTPELEQLTMDKEDFEVKALQDEEGKGLTLIVNKVMKRKLEEGD